MKPDEQNKDSRAAGREEAVAWRCFHCDETFSDHESASAHFGTHERHAPACTIDAAEYRRMEKLQERFAEEDADCHRAMYRMQSEHQVALRRAEEDGYAKGVRDAEAELTRPIAPAGNGGECLHDWVIADNSRVTNASLCMSCGLIAPTDSRPKSSPVDAAAVARWQEYSRTLAKKPEELIGFQQEGSSVRTCAELHGDDYPTRADEARVGWITRRGS